MATMDAITNINLYKRVPMQLNLCISKVFLCLGTIDVVFKEKVISQNNIDLFFELLSLRLARHRPSHLTKHAHVGGNMPMCLYLVSMDVLSVLFFFLP